MNHPRSSGVEIKTDRNAAMPRNAKLSMRLAPRVV